MYVFFKESFTVVKNFSPTEIVIWLINIILYFIVLYFIFSIIFKISFSKKESIYNFVELDYATRNRGKCEYLLKTYVFI